MANLDGWSMTCGKIDVVVLVGLVGLVGLFLLVVLVVLVGAVDNKLDASW